MNSSNVEINLNPKGSYTAMVYRLKTSFGPTGTEMLSKP